MDVSGDENTGDTTSGTMSSGSSASDTMAKSGRAEANRETGEISRITGSSVVRTVVTFVAGLGLLFALLYALSVVLNAY